MGLSTIKEATAVSASARLRSENQGPSVGVGVDGKQQGSNSGHMHQSGDLVLPA